MLLDLCSGLVSATTNISQERFGFVPLSVCSTLCSNSFTFVCRPHVSLRGRRESRNLDYETAETPSTYAPLARLVCTLSRCSISLLSIQYLNRDLVASSVQRDVTRTEPPQRRIDRASGNSACFTLPSFRWHTTLFFLNLRTSHTSHRRATGNHSIRPNQTLPQDGGVEIVQREILLSTRPDFAAGDFAAGSEGENALPARGFNFTGSDWSNRYASSAPCWRCPAA